MNEPYQSNFTVNSSDSNFTNHESESLSEPPVKGLLFALTLIATFGAFVRYILNQLILPVPYTAILLISGIAIGIASRYLHPFSQYAYYLSSIDAEAVSHAALPILIFEAAISIDFHSFMRCFSQCLILSVLGLLLTSSLIAVFAVVLFPYGWDLKSGWLFGFILSTTDPTPVLPLLRNVGNSKMLTTLLEGESFLNDGSAIVGFNLCLDLLRRNVTKIHGYYFYLEEDYYFAFDTMRKVVFAPLFGYVTGAATVFCLARVFKDDVIEITITLCSAYLTYTVSEELLEISGVIAVGSMGLMISAHKESINPEIEIYVQRFWEMLTYFSKTAVFVGAGLIIAVGPTMSLVELTQLFFFVATYIAVVLIRLLVLFSLKPLLSRFGYGMDSKSTLVISWAGIKGAIALLLALLANRKSAEFDKLRNKVLSIVTGTVALNLLINVTTTKLLLRRLGVDRISKERRGHMANAIRHINICQENSINVERKMRLHPLGDWDYVYKYTYFENPYEISERKLSDEEKLEAIEASICGENASKKAPKLTKEELKDLENEYRINILSAQKVIYWRKFQEGLLGAKEVSFLLSLAEKVADQPGRYITVKDLQDKWKVSKFCWRLEKLLRKEETLVFEKQPKYKSVIYSVIKHRAYDITILFIIGCNICVIVSVMLSAKYYKDSKKYALQMLINLMFIALYLTDSLLKVVALSCKRFWEDHNNKIDVVVNVFALVESAAEFVFFLVNYRQLSSNTIIIFQGLKLVRAVKFLRLIHILRRMLLHVVEKHIFGRLFSRFNVYCAYHAGESEIIRLLEEIIEIPEIAAYMQEIFERNLLEINKQIAHFKESHPDTAVAVTTRHATRSTLNELHQQINYLWSAGLIEDIIYRPLIEICEEKIKRLYNSPTRLKSHTPEDILKNIEWISGDEEIFSFFRGKFELILYKEEEMITRYGDNPKGIRIITMGTVKVTGVIVNDVNGGLPNTDSFHWFSVATKCLEDYLTVGAVLGELGFLTGKPSLTVATCECRVQVLSISQEVLEEAAAIFNHLEKSLLARMWRFCSVKIARRIFAKSGYYQDWELQNILRKIDSAYMPHVGKGRWYNITAEMENIALVQGVATDPNTSKQYIAPCHIPRNIGSLTFQVDAVYDPVILIIGTASIETTRSADPHIGGKSVTESRMNLARVIRSYSLHRATIFGQTESRYIETDRQSLLGRKEILPSAHMQETEMSELFGIRESGTSTKKSRTGVSSLFDRKESDTMTHLPEPSTSSSQRLSELDLPHHHDQNKPQASAEETGNETSNSQDTSTTSEPGTNSHEKRKSSIKL